jgi:hypothetical protein
VHILGLLNVGGGIGDAQIKITSPTGTVFVANDPNSGTPEPVSSTISLIAGNTYLVTLNATTQIGSNTVPFNISTRTEVDPYFSIRCKAMDHGTRT